MNLNGDNWIPDLTSFIQIIKQYPIIYTDDGPKTNKKYKTAVETAWNEIETALGIPKKSCKQLWKNIKLRYSKFKILFNSGKLSEEVIKSYMDKSHLFYGSLSFLDPYISDITESAIPSHIHKEINKIFDFKDAESKQASTTVLTHDQIIRAIRKRRTDEKTNKDSDGINMKCLRYLITDVIEHKLNELFPLQSNPEPQTANNEINLGLQSEIIIEENIKKEETVTEIDDENEKPDCDIIPSININSEIGGEIAISPIISGIEDTKHDAFVVSDVNTMIIEDKIASNVPSRISDNNMNKFFIDLGEVMSVELSKEKQILLKGQINALLRNISDEELT